MILETNRLVLRELTLDDADAMFKVFGDPVAMRYLPAPYTLDEVKERILRLQDYTRDNGFSLWAVVLKDTQEMVGDCGLTFQKVLGEYEYEIGYHIDPAFQGKGIATEAARACLEWAFANTYCKRVISYMTTENLASRRVAEKVHARFLGDCGEKWGHSLCYYGTTRQEYKKS